MNLAQPPFLKMVSSAGEYRIPLLVVPILCLRVASQEAAEDISAQCAEARDGRDSAAPHRARRANHFQSFEHGPVLTGREQCVSE